MLKTFLVVLALLLFASVPANSREITKGTATVLSSNNFVFVIMSASGADFSASVAGSNFGIGFAPCIRSQICSPGQVINLSASSGQWSFGDFSGGMTIDGTQYRFVNQTDATLPDLVGSGRLGFGGGSVMIPFTDAPTITLKAPFTMNGSSLSGRARGILGIGLPLTGSGIGTLVLRQRPGLSEYVLVSLTYEFVPRVGVDIKPEHINPRSRGKVPVVILSTEAFDAAAIDPDTVTVAGAHVDIKPNGTTASSLEDVNDDGLLDLVIHINTTDLQLTSLVSEVRVEGFTIDGKFFWGTDTIEVAE